MVKLLVDGLMVNDRSIFPLPTGKTKFEVVLVFFDNSPSTKLELDEPVTLAAVSIINRLDAVLFTIPLVNDNTPFTVIEADKATPLLELMVKLFSTVVFVGISNPVDIEAPN